MELIGQVLAAVFTAGAIYGAIRADIRALIERVGNVERSASRAHQRIDSLLQNG